ncbi:MAG: hypothetical protein M3N51_00220 [Actinomycetota bacterium]|nr:hypothetical protein [Actinomycetota bacterium]
MRPEGRLPALQPASSTQGDRPGRRIALGLLLVTLLGAAAVFGSVEAPSAIQEPPTTLPPAPALPDRFDSWPPLLLTWKVVDQDQGEQEAVFDSSISWNPCRATGSAVCYVRFAWDEYRRWSLSASADSGFHDSNPKELTLGELHYGVLDGMVVWVREAGRVPPLDRCDDLLLAYRRGESVEVHAEGPGVVVLSKDEEFARCQGPAGIPLGFSQGAASWEMLALELRPPSDREVGRHLVEGRVNGTFPSCESQGPVGLSVRAWLQDLAAASLGEPLGPTFDGLLLRHPLVPGERPVVLSATPNDRTLLLPDMRRRLLAQGVVADEALEPRVLVSVVSGGLRIWIRFTESPGVERILRERAAAQLGGVALDLVATAAERPYRGPPPEC